MKTAFKKSLAIVLAAVMLLCALPFTASATTYSGTCGDNLTWSLDTSTGVLNITGTGAMYRYNFSNMPEFLNYSISAVTIENGVTSIGSYAFFDCVQMKSVSIPGSVETIGGWAFANCDNLESIIIPYGVKLISNGAFYDCDTLKSVTISATVTQIREYSFSSCDMLENITVDSENQYFSNDNYGVLFNKDKSNLLNYPIGNTRTSYEIPDSVKTVEDEAFGGCTNLERILIPASVTRLGEGPFVRCEKLEEIIVNSDNTVYSSDEYGVLFSKDKTVLVQYPAGNTRENYTIPDGVERIGYCAFFTSSDLTDVIIPDSLTIILESAFSYCDGLTNVYYTGTENEWNEILIGDFNDPLKNANIHFKDISDDAVIPAPSQTTIKYGDSIILHVDPAKIPEGGYVEWVASNNNFTFNVSNVSKTCKIKPSISGSTTFTATVYDKDGNPISIDEQVMTSKAGFFDKLIAFFKSIFGLSKVYEY